MRQRAVLATSIAETSLSVAGVRAVVDFGKSREPSFAADHMGNILRTMRALIASCNCRFAYWLSWPWR
jgi:HrpA-like RNA helicase